MSDSCEWTREDVEAQLAKILKSPDFVKNKSASKFLKFVVEETLEGRGGRLKAFTIGVEVFERDPSFDPQANPIVRVQAVRLRQLLDSYFSGEGADDAMRIAMPIGAYRVRFEKTAHGENKAPTGDTSSSEALPVKTAPIAQPVRARNFNAAAALVLAGIAVVICGVGAGLFRSGQDNEWKNVIVVEAKGLADLTLPAFAETFVATVKSHIGEFEDVVVDETPDDAPRRRYTLTITLHSRAEQSASYSLSLQNAKGVIIYSESNSILSSSQEMSKRAAIIAAKIAAPYGVIYADTLANGADGHDCVTDSFEYFRHQNSRDLHKVEECLRAMTHKHPNYVPAITALSRIYLHEYRLGLKPSGNMDPLLAANALAMRAVELGPQKARAFKSVFEVRFFQRRYAEAFEAADRAMELSPYAADILYRVGAARISRGDLEKGKALLDRARTLNPMTPDWARFYFFLEALGRGDAVSAAQAADAPGVETTPLGLVALAIVAAQRNAVDQKAKYMSALAQSFPTIAADIPGALDRWGLSDPLQKTVLTALRS